MRKILVALTAWLSFATVAYAQSVSSYVIKDINGAQASIKTIPCPGNTTCPGSVPIDSNGIPLTAAPGTSASSAMAVQGATGGLPLNINCISGCGGSGGTASSFASTFPSLGTAIGVKNGGNMVGLNADGSGNLLVAIGAGSVSITGALPSFASPQTVNQGTPPWSFVGNIASGSSDSGAPLKTGGVFNTTQPTVTTGQRVDAQMTSRGAQIVAPGIDGFAVSGTVTANLGTIAGVATSVLQTSGGQKTQVTDAAGNPVTVSGGNLSVTCANCSGSGVSTIDEAAFSAGTSLFAGGGGFFQTTATNNPLTNGQQGMFQVTQNRALFTNLRNASGAEIGTLASPLQSVTGDTTATLSGMTALNAATQIALAGRQSVSVLLSGTFTATLTPEVSADGGTTWIATQFYNSSTQTFSSTTSVVGTLDIVGTGGKTHARVRISAFTSGTVTGQLTASSQAPSAYSGDAALLASINSTGNIQGLGSAGTPTGGVLTVQGALSMTPFLTNPGTAASWAIGATGVGAPANALLAGARAQNAEPTAVTNGQLASLSVGLEGKLINLPYANKENMARGAGTSTSTSAITVMPASGSASLKEYVTDLYCTRNDTGTTAITGTLNDSASTPIDIPNNGGGGGFKFSWHVPLVVAANTAVTLTPSSGVTTLKCGATGYYGT